MALGYRYWGGIGVTASCEKALEQYRRVAATVASEVSAAGTGPAIQRIRLLDEMEGTGTTNGNVLNSDILDYYTMLAERGDLQAQVIKYIAILFLMFVINCNQEHQFVINIFCVHDIIIRLVLDNYIFKEVVEFHLTII
jgi:hypothetical protein